MGRDFFISYTGVNRAWAEWIAVELERAGFTTVVQAFDFGPGSDWAHEMQKATATAGRTIAVLSPAYFGSAFGEAEWRAAFAKDPTGELGLLIPVRVQPCEPPGVLASRVYVDLVGADESEARRRLLAAVEVNPSRPTKAPYPGDESRPRFPGLGPRLSNLPPRNPNFTGRDVDLVSLNEQLRDRSMAAVLPVGAVHGLGGVGKTQLALEYAHRYRSDFELIWWIDAEQPTTVIAALAGLAARVHVPEAVDQTDAARTVLEWLRGRDRWLLIYDNAESPDELAGLLPAGWSGQVLVTSRWSAWTGQAAPLRLDTLARKESVVFLRRRAGVQADDAEWSALADLVGDLPLALEEAAAYLEETQESLPAYLQLLQDRARELLDLEGLDAAKRDRRRVGTVWSVSLDRVKAEAPAAEALLNLLAFLAPEVPRSLPTEVAGALPEPLATAVRDPLSYNRLLAEVGRYSLATVTSGELRLHRLVQTVIHARLGSVGERHWATIAIEALRAAFPSDSWDVSTWPLCERLLPHLLTATSHADRLGVAGADAGWLLDRASTYVRERGQYQQAKPLAQQALAVTESALGPSHSEVAWRHNELGRVLRDLGDLNGARARYELAVSIGETALGPDHGAIGTMRNDLGGVLHELGDLTGAREQLELALRISEAALGPDHPSIGVRRSNLGSVLQDLGDLSGARDQYELALRIGEAALGPDHPDIGIRHNNLGSVLEAMGDLTGAREQHELALRISEAALGPSHPDIGIWRSNLGFVLLALGDTVDARLQFELALRIMESALGPDHQQVRNLRAVLDAMPPPG